MSDVMQGKHLQKIILILIIGFIIFTFENVSADPVEDQVECDYNINIINGISLNTEVNAEVEKITLSASGSTYTSSDINSFVTSNPEFLGAIKYAIKELFSNQIKDSFPNAVITALNELPTYENGVFTDNFNVSFTNSFFLLNQTVNYNDFILGLYDSGVVINYTFPLTASTGWNNTYVFTLPYHMNFKRTNGTVQQNEILWEVNTEEGYSSITNAELSLKYIDPTSVYNDNTSIYINFEIDCSEPKQQKLNQILSVESLHILDYTSFPNYVTNIKSLPADTIRLSILNNFTNWSEIYEMTFLPINLNLNNLIEASSFNQSLEVEFSYDNLTTVDAIEPYNISQMDSDPMIKAVFTDDNIDFKIFDLPSRAIFGLINAGAKTSINPSDVNFADNLEEVSYPYNGTLIFPKHVFLEDKNVFVWNTSNLIKGNFTSDVAPTYSNQDIKSNITIIIDETDMNLLSFFTGKTELTINLYLEETQQRNVTLIPETLQIPSQLSLDYLNSDAFRICVEEKIFSNKSINEFLNSIKINFENKTGFMFPLLIGKAHTNIDVFEESLVWDENLSNMDSEKPVKINSFMRSTYSLPFEFSLLPPSFKVASQNITLTGIENQTVTYMMIFPQGTTVKVSDTLNKSITGETSDGSKFFMLSFNASESDLADVVTLQIQPSSIFVIGLFIPCMISILITIILFAVVYILRKKRNKMRRGPPPSEQGYEDQEYYVPPPPPSARK
jgi:hypothetical protein